MDDRTELDRARNLAYARGGRASSDRIAELEAILGELVAKFNPEPMNTHTVWDRAAAILNQR